MDVGPLHQRLACLLARLLASCRVTPFVVEPINVELHGLREEGTLENVLNPVLPAAARDRK